jgi:hypothetical protein
MCIDEVLIFSISAYADFPAWPDVLQLNVRLTWNGLPGYIWELHELLGGEV